MMLPAAVSPPDFKVQGFLALGWIFDPSCSCSREEYCFGRNYPIHQILQLLCVCGKLFPSVVIRNTQVKKYRKQWWKNIGTSGSFSCSMTPLARDSQIMVFLLSIKCVSARLVNCHWKFYLGPLSTIFLVWRYNCVTPPERSIATPLKAKGLTQCWEDWWPDKKCLITHALNLLMHLEGVMLNSWCTVEAPTCSYLKGKSAFGRTSPKSWEGD